jgi:hypothetical protein
LDEFRLGAPHKGPPDDITFFIHGGVDREAFGRSTFTAPALSLIVRSSDGILRRACKPQTFTPGLML